MKRMLFNATHPEETRVGIVDGQKLVDIDIETAGREARKSNIYKGIVTRIEPSLEACFINYGEERHGFLPFKEISRAYFKDGVDYRTATIREAITEGQELIVQVEKEERGNKGAALTTFISLAGRYLVLMPNNPRAGGVSRRIEGEERQELREAMDRLDVPNGMSTIARTAGIGRTTEELQWDLNYLLKLWDAIVDAAKPQYEFVTEENGRRKLNTTSESIMNGKPLKRINPAPFLIVEESNLVVRAIRDYFQPEIGEILVDTDDVYEQVRQFMAHVMPDMIDRVKRYRDDIPLFTRFQIEQQIETAYSRTVPLPSGGAIVIDHTEALVAIDVNSARATRGADIEETAFRTNCEAADEVARQMRLRDLGGLIVIDFIDMADAKNQRAVEQRLKDAIRFDRARVQTAKISRFGLMELSRQRLRPALSEGNHITCPRCNGVGVIRDTESCAIQVLRILQEEAMKEGTGAVQAQVPVDVATFLLNEKRNDITKLEARHRVPIILVPNTYLETPHYHIERIRQDDERLDRHQASFTLAEEIQTTADDPYAQKTQEDKPQRPKQVPVIKNLIERDPAPQHVEKQEKTENPDGRRQKDQKGYSAPLQPVAPQKGFFARIAEFLFGKSSEDEEKTDDAKTKKDAKASKSERNDKSRSTRGRRSTASERRGKRGERLERAEKTDRRNRTEEASGTEAQVKAAAAEKTDKAEKTEQPARQRRRHSDRTERVRTRQEKSSDEKNVEEKTVAEAIEAEAPTVQESVKAETVEALPVEKTEEPHTEIAEVKDEAKPEAVEATEELPSEKSRRRRSRRRRTTDAEIPATESAPETATDAAPASEAAEVAEGAEASGSEAEAEAIEGTRRRRPRRRRRSRTVEEFEAAEVTEVPEATQTEEAANPAKVEDQSEKPTEEKLVQIETKPFAAEEAQTETEPTPESEVLKVAPTISAQDMIAARLAAYEATVPLVQIETKPSPLSLAVRETFREAAEHAQVESLKKPARAKKKSEATPGKPEEKLIQIETKAVEAEASSVKIEIDVAEAETEVAQSAKVATAEDAVEETTVKEAAAEEAFAAAVRKLEIAESLAENLAQAGLEQIETKPQHETFAGYPPVVYPGRLIEKRGADEDEGPLIQVETNKV